MSLPSCLGHDISRHQPPDRPWSSGDDDQIVKISQNWNEVGYQINWAKRIRNHTDTQRLYIPGCARVSNREVQREDFCFDTDSPCSEARKHGRLYAACNSGVCFIAPRDDGAASSCLLTSYFPHALGGSNIAPPVPFLQIAVPQLARCFDHLRIVLLLGRPQLNMRGKTQHGIASQSPCKDNASIGQQLMRSATSHAMMRVRYR